MLLQIQLGLKRICDVLICGLLLIVASPMLIILALLIKLSSPGPVFFVQERMGRWERSFRIYKFRTMTGQPNPHDTRWTKAEEARITPVGSFMRDYGLDELPQLVNILKGDMSIIGPRPPLPSQVTEFSPQLRKMFRMRPGVLSLAAIAGRRSLPMEERYKLHVTYVENWSLALDLKILWQSLFVVLGKESARDIAVE